MEITLPMRSRNGDEMELNKLVADFCLWQETAGKVFRENEMIQKELKHANKKIAVDQEAAQSNIEETKHLKEIVNKLEETLAKRCDFEEENRLLKSEIGTMKASSAELEDAHSCQMTEALENIHTLSERHKAELASAKHEAQVKLRQEMETKDKEIQDKKAEIKLLQREKAELERIRHTDIVKLRLEYDAKMLKLQKQQNTRAQQAAAQPSSSNDIFRKKLQHVKAESGREIANLKRKVEQLERLQPAGSRSGSCKKSRLM